MKRKKKRRRINTKFSSEGLSMPSLDYLHALLFEEVGFRVCSDFCHISLFVPASGRVAGAGKVSVAQSMFLPSPCDLCHGLASGCLCCEMGGDSATGVTSPHTDAGTWTCF